MRIFLEKFIGSCANFNIFPLDKANAIIYNYVTVGFHGAVRVSTGILRHDKRGGPDKPVKLSNLKNKRQQ